MPKLEYNIWCRIEVHNMETDEHEDLDTDHCEYKVLCAGDLEQVASFIMRHQAAIGNHESGVLLELEDALQRQGWELED